MSAQAYLLDTNVIIGLEDNHTVQPAFAALIRIALEHKVGLFVHEAAKDDISRDKDSVRRNISMSKLEKFQILSRVRDLKKNDLLSQFGPIPRPNDLVDAMLRRALCDATPDLLETAQGVFILSAVWERSIVKYGRLGYRFGVMELGIVAHHLSMCLTASNVKTLHWGGGFEDLVANFIGLDPRSESVGHLLWYGMAND